MSGHLFLIDDDEDYLKVFATFLDAMGFSFEKAHSLQEARKILKSNSVFDLVLCDLNMPDGLGIDLIPDIKQKFPTIPLMMVTAQEDTKYIVEAIKRGASDYIVKPCQFEIMIEKINEHLKFKKQQIASTNLMDDIANPRLIGNSLAIKNLIREIGKVSQSNSPVILYGESGTGKSMLAEMIHENSQRLQQKLVTVNCAAIPKELLESEFFGHVKGAFTGAIKDKIGKFEFADKGSIFLDEIGDLALDLQAKLLRVLQGNEFERVGGLNTIKVDTRVIAATNRDLELLIKERKFREDLYYRLNVLPIYIPPLRHRKDDIPDLVNHYLAYYARKAGREFDILPAIIMQMLMDYSWPGNIRELQNVIERAVVIGRATHFKITDFLIKNLHTSESIKPVSTYSNAGLDQTKQSSSINLGQIEKNALLSALESSGGNVSKAAAQLKISRDTVYRRLKKYGIGLKR
ncbi:hypothetical protein BVY03_00175 [bacterium K02(2017)]|nr:hypothetical protein BVY03_00175 [bacterium K02(2017)]